MPWLAIPYNDPNIKLMQDKYKVEEIPVLMLINGEGKILVEDAMEDVKEKGVKVIDDWKKIYKQDQQQVVVTK